jgi:hypothetical protein
MDICDWYHSIFTIVSKMTCALNTFLWESSAPPTLQPSQWPSVPMLSLLPERFFGLTHEPILWGTWSGWRGATRSQNDERSKMSPARHRWIVPRELSRSCTFTHPQRFHIDIKLYQTMVYWVWLSHHSSFVGKWDPSNPRVGWPWTLLRCSVRPSTWDPQRCSCGRKRL